MLHFFQQFDLVHWIETIGYVGIFLIIFIETGFFFGFFLPGDSLVFTAGLLAAKGIFSLWILLPLLIITAFVGYLIGYWFGDKLGHWLLNRKESIFFRRQYIIQARKFYEKHGATALLLGRLVPIVRTFVPIVAGMVDMPYKRYVFFNFIGAVLWGGCITLLGYYIGGLIPDAVHFLLPAVIVIIILSVLPGVFHYIKEKRR